MWNVLKKLALVGLIPGVLMIVSAGITNMLPWEWLTYFFVILRHLISLFSWLFFDIDAFWTIGGWVWLILGFYWIYLISIKIIHFFNKE